MMKRILTCVSALLIAAPVVAQEAKLGGARVWEKYNCASCHGQDAKTSIMPEYPILAGQHGDYLRQALMAYQKGQAGAPPSANIRKNPVMGAMVANLTQQEIDQLSVWLARLPGPLSTR